MFPGAVFVSSPRATGYRSKVKWIAGYDREGRVRLGFYRPGSHRFLPIGRCAQLVPELARLETDLPALLQDAHLYDEAKNSGYLKAVFAKSNSRGEILVTFVVSQRPDAAQTEILQRAARLPHVAGVTCNLQPERTNRLAGDDEWVLLGADSLVEPDWPLPLHFDAAGFSQANHDMAKAAVQAIADGLRGVNLPVIDLYCGAGPIALALLAAGHDVTGVEIQSKAVELARKSSGRIAWVHCDTDSFLRDLRPSFPVAVVVNPPRAGLSEFVVRKICELPIPHLAYMSCNPKTLARDAALLQACGFQFASVAGFDMFPQTPWFETVAHFIR